MNPETVKPLPRNGAMKSPAAPIATVNLVNGRRRLFVCGVMIDPNEMWGGGKVDGIAERINQATEKR